MSRRRINPDTGEPELTYREHMFINEYINNGGNGKQAAIAAGYGSGRADQSAYHVLHRLRVQQHIQDRLSESTVSADEIIGTLVSFMRGDIAEVLDGNGDFDINLVRERRLGHLLKTVTRTTRKIITEPGKPPELAQDYRIQLHSPAQAASILARLMGINRKTSDLQSDRVTSPEEASPNPFDFDHFAGGHSDLTGPVRDEDFAAAHDDPPRPLSDCSGNPSAPLDELPPIIKDVLDPRAWMEALIKSEMQRDGRSRSAVLETLLQLRPEAAQFIQPDPDFQDDPLAIPWGQVANLPHMGAVAAEGDSNATDPPVQNSSPKPSSNPASTTPWAPQPSGLPSPMSLLSTSSPQTSHLQQLKPIGPATENLRKINLTQCLEHDFTQPVAASAPTRAQPTKT